MTELTIADHSVRRTHPHALEITRPATFLNGKHVRPYAPPPFRDILCAVDGSRGCHQALRQALALCGPGASLHCAAVSHEVTSGPRAQVDLGEQRARDVLGETAEVARRAGIEPTTTELLHGAPTSDLLLAEAAKHDLLAIGCHGGSRLSGVMAGSTATQVAHRTAGPLLVARDYDGSDFPRSILLASDGSPGSWAAARVATRLSQAYGSGLRLVYVPDGMHPERYRELLKQLTVIEKATGSSPAVVDDPGHVADRIVAAAGTMGASLIVIGHRGLRGVRALGSVSERVVHQAPCSVLVVPARETSLAG
jgi:nucleotide-binding universal stress UspA family protein